MCRVPRTPRTPTRSTALSAALGATFADTQASEMCNEFVITTGSSVLVWRKDIVALYVMRFLEEIYALLNRKN